MDKYLKDRVNFLLIRNLDFDSKEDLEKFINELDLIMLSYPFSAYEILNTFEHLVKLPKEKIFPVLKWCLGWAKVNQFKPDVMTYYYMQALESDKHPIENAKLYLKLYNLGVEKQKRQNFCENPLPSKKRNFLKRIFKKW